MDGQSVGEKDAANGSETRKELNAFFEQFFIEALDSPQSELFYRQKAAQLQDITPECIPALTRRLQKAGWAEQDVLVQLLAQFRGVEHVGFLQEFVGREAFMPKTGMKILDIFNKSDVIIDSGIAGRLVDREAAIGGKEPPRVARAGAAAPPRIGRLAQDVERAGRVVTVALQHFVVVADAGVGRDVAATVFGAGAHEDVELGAGAIGDVVARQAKC